MVIASRPRLQRARPLVRRGMASVEVVLATAFGLLCAGFLYRQGTLACNGLFQVIGSLVGWPYL